MAIVVSFSDNRDYILITFKWLTLVSLVVALFNAIAKTKKEAVEKEAAEKSEHKREGDAQNIRNIYFFMTPALDNFQTYPTIMQPLR